MSVRNKIILAILVLMTGQVFSQQFYFPNQAPLGSASVTDVHDSSGWYRFGNYTKLTNSTSTVAKNFLIDMSGAQPVMNWYASDGDVTSFTVGTSDQMIWSGAGGGYSYSNGGIFLGSATGGNKGAGTINATALYDDNIQLIAPPFDSSHVANGGLTGADIRDAAVGATQLAPTAVTAGSYTNTSLTVDADGRITTAASGSLAAAGGWTDTGTEIEQTTTTDEVVIGGTAALNSAKVTIDGDADQVQLSIQGHSTQNANTILVENSAGADVLFHLYTSTVSALDLQAPAANAQVAFGLFPSTGSATGYSIVRDLDANGTNNFGIYDRTKGQRFVIDPNGLIGLSKPTTSPWANLGIAHTSHVTLSLTNSILGYDSTSGLIFKMPSTGAGFMTAFDGDFEFNSADAAKEYIFDIANDNDNDFILDDAGVLIFSSGQTNSFQVAPAANDIAAFTSAVGGYTFDSEASVKQHNIQDTTGVVLSAPGAATVSVSNLKLDTFASAALDTAVTLTGTIGDIIYISTRAATRDITFLDSGNFQLGAERLLDDPQDVLVLMAVTTTVWKEISFSNNN